MTGRKLSSFISTFSSATAPLASPAIFRRWTAISLISAALRQNVWVKTAHRLYPNTYIFLIAHPGVGKTRVLNFGRDLIVSAKDLHLSPVSVTFASMVDAMTESTVEIVRAPEGKITYNSMQIIADELGAFISKYDNDMIAGLTAFYDPTPYQQRRRTGGADNQGIKLEIRSPQLNIITGSTPQNLMSFMPEGAWGQGFTSRIIMVFSDERLIVDDFADHGPTPIAELVSDLKHISTLYGPFTVTQAYKDAVTEWRKAGEPPVPEHPRLIHYLTRRRVHLYKLSMISSVDRDDSLYLTEADFFTALEWLSNAEVYMSDIFKAGATSADAQAQDDIIHWMRIAELPGPDGRPAGISEHRIVQYARDKVPVHSILRLIEILESTGQIVQHHIDRRTGVRYFSATPSAQLVSHPSSGQSAPSEPSSVLRQILG